MNILSRIVESKREEVEAKRKNFRKPPFPGRQCGRGVFFSAFRGIKRIGVIAEIKKMSPSAGIICKNFNPLLIAREYVMGGVRAISVLTDRKFFGGSPQILMLVKNEFPEVPVLYKDFVIDPSQIYEAYTLGADAILLIAAVLVESKLKEFIQLCNSYGMDPLVEVHDESDLEKALKCGAYMIGINNRDLKTFKVDISVSLQLADMIPEEVVKISESGIESRSQIELLESKGFSGVLVGQACMESKDRIVFLKELQGR